MIKNIDKYTIIKELGRGGFATVYLADDTQSGRQVALKVLSSRPALETRLVKRFEREAKALARLDEHPNIITIYDFGETEGELYLAMEYLPGGSLRDYLSARLDKNLPFAQVFTILEQLAAALDYAHRRQMIHRDIKPDNVLLQDAHRLDRVVLTDFGLVKYPLAEASSLTQTNMVLGTRGYIAPEQLVGTAKEVTPASDIYSFGALAYQLFTGELPPLMSEPPNPLELNPNLSETIARGLRRGLAKNPVERPASAHDFVALLKGEQKPAVLVVDDDKNMRLTIKRILRAHCLVELAGGVDEALAKLSRYSFELIIVDLNMASDERAGFKLLETINWRYPGLRKIILTAKYDLPSVTEGYDYGVEAYIPKDQHLEANLLQKLRRALER